MKIINNENLTYTEIPGGSFGPRDRFEMDTQKMFLTSFRRYDKQTLVLNLKIETNDKSAYIRAS